jgi:DNA-binding response OmpR family regulator
MDSKGKILVLEPDGAVRILLSDYFMQKGYSVMQATDPDQALAMLEHEPPDVVLFDADLLPANPVEVLQRLHRMQPSLSVIRVTGRLDRALGGGSVQIIDLDRLNRAVTFAMARKRTVAAVSA